MIQDQIDSHNPKPTEQTDSQFYNKPNPSLPLNYDTLITIERQLRGALEQVWRMQGKRMKIIESRAMSLDEYRSEK